jgi:hypothetical protein
MSAASVRLTVVKVVTDRDGLYGYGCATFTQRVDLVRPAVEKYLKPFPMGKATHRIEDIWQSCYDSSYWKNGPAAIRNAATAPAPCASSTSADSVCWGENIGLPPPMRPQCPLKVSTARIMAMMFATGVRAWML